MPERFRRTRLFRWLLRLFPAEFRGDFGDDMSDVFADQRVEASARGRLAVGGLWLRTLGGAAALAPREHLEVLRRDAGYALRQMWQQRLMTVAVIVTLALGLGASIAMFTVVKAVLLDLPFRDPHQLVIVLARLPRGLSAGISQPQYEQWSRQDGPFESIAALWGLSPVLTGAGETRRMGLECVSPNMFATLGVAAVVGRTFTEQEGRDAAASPIVISHAFWTRTYGRGQDAIGRTLVLEGLPATIVGIMPASFDGARARSQQDGWITIADCVRRSQREGRSIPFVNVYARLKPGVSAASAKAQLESALLPPADGSGPPQLHLLPLMEQIFGEIQEPLFALQGAAAFVLLIGCANVASLLLGRAETRRGELAVRFALGCTRGRMIRQLLTESVVLSVAGGAAGLVCAYWSLEWLRALIPGWVPRLDRIAIDREILLACLALSMATGLLFGLLPAWQASRLSPGLTLKGSSLNAGPARRRTRAALVIVEIALSVALLANAGLLFRTFLYLRPVDPGFDPRGKVALTISVPRSRYADPGSWARFAVTLQARLASVPGVRAVSAATYLPLSGSVSTAEIEVDGGQSPRTLTVFTPAITPNYFAEMGIRVLRGRGVSVEDRAGAPEVALVNETLARRLWPGQEPLGRQVRLKLLTRTSTKTIVGLVRDMRSAGSRLNADSELFVPLAQNPMSVHRFVLTTAMPAEVIGPLVRGAVASVDPALPTGDIERVSSLTTDRAVAQWRFATSLMGAFALTALVLTGVGLLAVISCWVIERTPEIGVRMALGATRGDVLRLFVGRSVVLILAGVVGGVALGAATTRFVATWLVGITPLDRPTFAGACALMAAVALAAAYLSARRATRIDPLAALRNS